MLGDGRGIQRMGRPGVAGAAALLLALAACGTSQEREKQAQELAAAEKKLAEVKALGEDMAREKQLITTKLAEAQARLDEAQAAYHGTLAGAAYLAAEEDNGLVMTWEMNAAREGFQLAEAARQKDKKAVEVLAERVLADERPCAAKADGEGDGEGDCGPCNVAPYEDACTDVEKNTSSSPEWNCTSLAAVGEGLPAAAFCTSAIEHPAPGVGVESTYAEQSLPTELQVVRVAFVHQGRLYVSDYPKPNPELYNPPNVEPLVACTATTARNSCIHDCEVQYNRYEDPCACQPDSYEHEHDDSEETEDEESDEPPEVRQARQAAAEAEAEAQAASERAQEAQQEVAYQECLAACEPSEAEDESAEADPEAPPDPVSTQVKMSLEAAPAPGIFVVSRVVRALGPTGQTLSEEKSTLVLKHVALEKVWAKLTPSTSEPLGALERVIELEEVVSEGQKPSLKPLPGKSEPTLVGLSAGRVVALSFSSAPGSEPLTQLASEAVCQALRAEPKRFPETYLKACPEPSTAAPAAEPAAGATAATEAPADAGTAADAGEVTP